MLIHRILCAPEMYGLCLRGFTICLKLINRHSKVIEAVHDDFWIFTESERDDEDVKTSSFDWLTPLLDDFEMLAENIMTDYLQPLENMIDLVRMTPSFDRHVHVCRVEN